MRRITYLGQ